MEFIIKMDDGEEYNLQDDLNVNESDLNFEFCRQSKLFAKWATAAELAREYMDRQKVILERLYGQLDVETRSKFKELNFKMTEKMINVEVEGNKVYRVTQDKYLRLRAEFNRANTGKEAMQVKKEMLISLGANYRAENAADPTILKDAAKTRARRIAARKK